MLTEQSFGEQQQPAKMEEEEMAHQSKVLQLQSWKVVHSNEIERS